PPRFFEAFLRGRAFTEVPDITARICGICPVAYQVSSIAAMEDVCGVAVPEEVRALRRLLYCGEWIESHALHVFFLHGPDYLGYDSAFAMARDHRGIVERALQLKKAGNGLMRVVGGREIHPVNVRVGGFYRAPAPREFAAVVEELEIAREFALEAVAWTAGLPCPELEEDFEFVALRAPGTYAIESGRLASSGGLDLAPGEYGEHFAEHQVPHSTALHSRLRDGRAYLTGPLARYALSGDRLSPLAREAADAAGLGPACRNPFRSIVVRAVEILYAVDEALRLLAAYVPPDPPAVAVAPRAGTGCGWSEAPRGMLWHRYAIDGEGTIQDARIVPPTSQNQARIEQSLAAVVAEHVDLPDDELQHRCEQAVRSFDPCISCATHFLRLEIDRC
ncbi:MAG TPA: Ni/Fe hydrogenase subunit alpha, partial [Solirubrobacteraceae bacterium]|nr:Ni/Fe hydrogenase subunit alpha [Solirubrobacteraceae bacterium]